MITGVRQYSTQTYSNLNFGAKMSKGLTNSAKKIVEISSNNKTPQKENLWDSIKNIISELFPKLDPAYRKIMEPTKEVKPFRVHIKKDVAMVGNSLYHKDVNYIIEYSNPNAKKIYKAMKKTNDPEEITRLSLELGDYRVIDVDLEKKMKKAERIIDKYL